MRKKILAFLTIMVVSVGAFLLQACTKFDPNLPSYDMNLVDLSTIPNDVDEEYKYMFEQNVVATPTESVDIFGADSYYLGHPDTVLLNNGDILAAFPVGHGRGETLFRVSHDGGITWEDNYTAPLPESFKKTDETPTIYKLDIVNDNGDKVDEKLLLASGRPGWGKKGQGFDVSISTSKTNGYCDGKVWSEHKNYFSEHAESGYYAKDGEIEAIVAFASFTQLYENGKPINKWMGIFHDYDFNVLKTYLTFDENGEMQWTYPTRVLDNAYRSIEKDLQFCEPEVVRSPDGKELAMIYRTNSKKSYSHVAFSTDEGKTWSAPQELSRELTGERHKAEYTPDGKLVITYRHIGWKIGQEHKSSAWYSLGWLAWVGDYEDLHKGADGKGDFTIKLAHTYLDGQTAPTESSNADTGYTGLTIDSNGNVVALSYGRFSPDNDKNLGGRTYIVSKRFNLNDICKYFGKTLS